jgi:signal transduction histidine kinase
MSLRLRIFEQDFAGRLCASLGSEEAFRAEKLLCAARVVLALYCSAWIHLTTTKLAAQPWRVQGLLNSYLLCSCLIFVLLRLHGKADSTYRLTTLAVDLFFAAALTIFTGSSESPYAVLWIFVVMSAAYRWGLREINLIAGICALLLLGEVQAFRLYPQYFKSSGESDFTTDQFLLRGAFLIVISLVFGYLALQERRLRAESTLVARVLGRTLAGAKMDLALDALFAELASLYLPRKAVVAIRKGNIEEAFSWEMEQDSRSFSAGMVRSVLQFSKLEAASFSCPVHTWYVKRSARQSNHAAHFLAFDELGRRVISLDSEPLHSYILAADLHSLMVTSFSFGETLNGRLILVGPSPHENSKEAIRFLQSLMKQIGPVVQSIYLFQDIHTRVEDQVRARLTRELHDGTLQSLLSAEMQIEVLRRQRPNHWQEMELRLVALQSLIRQEALNLRDLIENTKPLTFSPKQLPDFLAELVVRFRRETGISVRLETGEENIALAPSTCHEIVRIVQEGLSNVRKHSGASNVVIQLYEGDEGLRKLLIADDGRGFGFRGRVTQSQLDVSHRGPGVIKERVRLIGGELTIESSPEHGVRLEITIPGDSRV